MHWELNRTGVTLKTLYDEYCLDCKNNNQVHRGYTKYCNEYKKFIKQKGFVSHIEHKAGDRIEVDWSGPTMSYIDQESSKTVKVYLFVADLVSSRLAYVEPCLNMNMDMNTLDLLLVLLSLHLLIEYGWQCQVLYKSN